MRYMSFTFTNLDLHLNTSRHLVRPRDVRLLLVHDVVLLPDKPARHEVYISGDGPYEVWQTTAIGGEQISGRLFTAKMDHGVALARSELAQVLYRCRFLQERSGELVEEGLITRELWDVAKMVSDVTTAGRSSASTRQEAVRPSPLLAAAFEMGLQPIRPTGYRIGHWHVACPGSGHSLFVLAPKSRWYCPTCRLHGGLDELKALASAREAASRSSSQN